MSVSPSACSTMEPRPHDVSPEEHISRKDSGLGEEVYSRDIAEPRSYLIASTTAKLSKSSRSRRRYKCSSSAASTTTITTTASASASTMSPASSPKMRPTSSPTSRQSSTRPSRRPSVPRDSPSSTSLYRQARQQSVQLTTRDLEDALAFHQLSCTLFQPLSHTSIDPISTAAACLTPRAPLTPPPTKPMPPTRSMSSPPSASEFAKNRRSPPPPTSTPISPPTPDPQQQDADVVNDDDYNYDESKEQTQPLQHQNTVMHWNINRRRLEYAAIERSSRGLRGLFRQITPRCLAPRPSYQHFYDAKNQSDASSVRRYRLDLPEEDENDENENPDSVVNSNSNEKTMTTKKRKSTMTILPKKKTATRPGTSWSCF